MSKKDIKLMAGAKIEIYTDKKNETQSVIISDKNGNQVYVCNLCNVEYKIIDSNLIKQIS